jgi:hypothetical protein
MNLVNYLVRRDLNGARVEARRLAVMQRFIKDSKGNHAALNAPGSYLSGFVFEKSNQPEEALRYYDEALQHRPFNSLEEPIARLAEKSSYRTPRIDAVLERARQSKPPLLTSAANSEVTAGAGTTAATTPTTTASQAPSDEPAEVLVVINYGRVPAKIAKRVPIGLALTYASGFISPYDRARANRLAAQGLVTWVNFPALGKAHGNYGIPLFSLDGKGQPVEEALAVDVEAKKAWEEVQGSVVASAITRMIARVIAGEVAGQAAGGDTLGAVVSIVTQATLTANDTPDTRSWSTLPARIVVARVTLKPGVHWVDLQARGRRERYKLNIKPGDWAVVNLTVLR